VLLPLLGLTWIIGILAVNEKTQILAWIFSILNSLQVCLGCHYLKHSIYFFFLGCLHICEPCIEKQTGNKICILYYISLYYKLGWENTERALPYLEVWWNV